MPDGYYNDLKQKYGLAEDFVNKLQTLIFFIQRIMGNIFKYIQHQFLMVSFSKLLKDAINIRVMVQEMPLLV